MTKTSPALPGGRVYVYDEAGHLAGEYTNSGARIQEHIWLGDVPVAVISGGGAVFHVLSDHPGTPRQILDSAKRLRWRWDNTDPFGVNAPNQNPQGLGGFGYNLRFPGQYFDAEAGLFYNYFRDYDPPLGRYVQSDPIGLEGRPNTYLYAEANPLTYVDPLGLFSSLELCKNPRNYEACAAAGMAPKNPPKPVPAPIPLPKESFPPPPECRDEDPDKKCRFVREVYYGGPTKTCWYQNRGGMFTFPQWKDKPCPPIDPVTCMVDTTGLPGSK